MANEVFLLQTEVRRKVSAPKAMKPICTESVFLFSRICHFFQWLEVVSRYHSSSVEMLLLGKFSGMGVSPEVAEN